MRAAPTTQRNTIPKADTGRTRCCVAFASGGMNARHLARRASSGLLVDCSAETMLAVLHFSEVAVDCSAVAAVPCRLLLLGSATLAHPVRRCPVRLSSRIINMYAAHATSSWKTRDNAVMDEDAHFIDTHDRLAASESDFGFSHSLAPRWRFGLTKSAHSQRRFLA